MDRLTRPVRRLAYKAFASKREIYGGISEKKTDKLHQINKHKKRGELTKPNTHSPFAFTASNVRGTVLLPSPPHFSISQNASSADKLNATTHKIYGKFA